MNKLKVTIAALLIACLGIGMASAQTAPAAATSSKQSTTKKSTTKPKAKMVTPTTATQKDAGKAQPKPAQHLKKDGTPDMRYKENKAAAKTSTPKAAPAAAPAAK